MVSSSTPVFAVIGAGSWGTALSMQLDRGHSRAILWGRNPQQVSEMQETRVNARFLPSFTLPDSIEIQADLATAVTAADHVLLVVPSHAFGDMVARIAPLLKPDQGT